MKLTKIKHGLYSNMISAKGINILFDFRINNQPYKRETVLLIYCQHPGKLIKRGANMLNTENQRITAKTAKEARELFYENILKYM